MSRKSLILQREPTTAFSRRLLGGSRDHEVRLWFCCHVCGARYCVLVLVHCILVSVGIDGLAADHVISLLRVFRQPFPGVVDRELPIIPCALDDDMKFVFHACAD